VARVSCGGCDRVAEWPSRYSREDIKGAKFGEELERIGFKGDSPASHEENKLSAHFEVHIEQGPILERENKPVAVVLGVQGKLVLTVLVPL
jgi:hypothetical protein